MFTERQWAIILAALMALDQAPLDEQDALLETEDEPLSLRPGEIDTIVDAIRGGNRE